MAGRVLATDSTTSKVDLDTSIQAESPSRQSLDMMQILPFEVIEMILSHLSIFDLSKLQAVSKSWYQNISGNPQLWTKIDFRAYNHRFVTKQILKRCIDRSKGSVTELYLHRIAHRYQDSIGDVISESCHKNRLQVLHAELWTNLFIGNSAPLDWTRFEALKTLQLSSRTVGDVIRYMAVENRFPNLQTMYFYGTGDCTPVPEVASAIPLHSADRIQVTAASLINGNLRNFVIDASPKPIHLSSEFYKFLRLWPNLQTLWLIQCYIPLQSAEATSRRFNLNETNKQLRDVNLSYSRLETMPNLPPSCEKLVLRHSRGPGSTPRYLRVDSENRVSYADALVDEEPQAVITDEYMGLRHFDVSFTSLRFGNDVFRSLLQRVDASRLVRLDIQGCPGLTTSSLQDLATYVPELRILCVGHNSWFSDDALASLFRSRKLEYIDISGTNIRIMGLIKFLGGDDIDANGKRISTLNLTMRIEAMYTTDQHIRMQGRTKLVTLVMNGCDQVSLQSSQWMRGLGIQVEHELSLC